MGPPATLDAGRSQLPDVEEIVRLCDAIDAKLEVAVGWADGDASSVVLVLDLDETAFSPLTVDGLATSAWFEAMMKRWAPCLEKAETMAYENTLDQVLAVVDAFYRLVPVSLTDEALPALLSRCKSRGIATLGLTSRRPMLAQATWAQMGSRVQLDFDLLAPPPGPDSVAELDALLRTPEHLPPDRKDPSLWEGVAFERGIWFTANANKGTVLRQVLPPGKHVVFADDSLRHVRAVRTALQGHAASVIGLHYTAATAAARIKLDTASCDRALARMVAQLYADGDTTLRELVKEGQPFLRRFIASQVAVEEDVDPQLQALATSLAGESACKKSRLA